MKNAKKYIVAIIYIYILKHERREAKWQNEIQVDIYIHIYVYMYIK